MLVIRAGSLLSHEQTPIVSIPGPYEEKKWEKKSSSKAATRDGW